MDESIHQLPISTRLRHCLEGLGIETVDEFLRCPKESWLDAPGIGLTTIQEMSRLTTEIKRERRAKSVLFSSTFSSPREDEERSGDENECGPGPSGSIYDLPLSPRLRHCLRSVGVRSVGDFLERPIETWLGLRNVGKKTIRELLRLLDTLEKKRPHSQRPAARPRQAAVPFTPKEGGERDVPIQDTLPIGRLLSSTATLTRLRAIGITDVGAFMRVPVGVWSTVPGIGSKALREIFRLNDYIRDQRAISLSLSYGALESPCPSISKQLAGWLGGEKIKTTGDFLASSPERWWGNQDINEKALHHIFTLYAYLDVYALFPGADAADRRDESVMDSASRISGCLLLDLLPGKWRTFYEESVTGYGMAPSHVLSSIKNVIRSRPGGVPRDLLSLLYECPALADALSAKILGLIPQEGFQRIPAETLEAGLPSHLHGTGFVEGFLRKMEKDNLVRLEEDSTSKVPCPSLHVLNHITASQYFDRKREEAKRTGGQVGADLMRVLDIIEPCLRGHQYGITIRAISKKAGITPAECAMVCRRFFSEEAPVLWEEQFRELFNRYYFRPRSFCRIFDLPLTSYTYLALNSTVPKDSKLLISEEILDDDAFPGAYRTIAGRFLEGCNASYPEKVDFLALPDKGLDGLKASVYPRITDILDDMEKWARLEDDPDKLDEHLRDIELVRRRLNGYSEGALLADFGREYGVTTQRVSQICHKLLSMTPTLWEDQFRDLFNKYDFTEESFCNVFDEPKTTYAYLCITGRPRGGNKLPVTPDVFSDELFPPPLMQKEKSGRCEM